MTSYWVFAHIAAFAFTVSLTVSGFMRLLKITDMPNVRSSHTVPTPTCGGAGVVAGMAASMLGLYLIYPDLASPVILGGLGVLGLGIAGLGLLDDIYDLSSRLKFALIMLMALMTPFVTGAPQALPFGFNAITISPEIGFAGAALWVFVVMNSVNFMDGANGLMGSFMMIATAGLSVMSMMLGIFEVAIISAALCAAILGFLIYNHRTKPSIFSGDIGSLFIGFVFAALVLRLTVHPKGELMLFAGPLLFLPFLTDSLLTLLVRAKKREPMFSAHRSHIYQRLIQSGKSHMQVTCIYMVLGLICLVLTLAGGHTGLIGSMFYFLLWVTIASWLYLKAYRRLTKDI